MKTGPQLIPLWRADSIHTEVDSADRGVCSTDWVPGPFARELENRLALELDVNEALCVSSRGRGLLLALDALGIGTGDEIILSAMGNLDMANAVVNLGARVVLVDCLPDSPCLDPYLVESAVGPQTRAIVCSHAGRKSGPAEQLGDLANESDITLIEDASAEFALGASREKGAMLGHLGLFSLNDPAILSTEHAAFLVCPSAELGAQMRRLLQKGWPASSQPCGPHHAAEYRAGISEQQARLGLAQLDFLEHQKERLMEIHGGYCEGLAGLEALRVCAFDMYKGTVPLWTELDCSHRHEVEMHLAAAGIETRRVQRPLSHEVSLRSSAPYHFPSAEQLSERLLILPGGPSLPLEDMDRVIECLTELCHNRHAA